MTLTMPRWIAVAIALLLGVWLVAPATVPLYDSIRPDDPYRYVQPPSGWRQGGPPSTAQATVDVHNGVNDAQFCNSSEFGPQISLYVPAGALGVPAGTTKVTVTATPLAPAAPLPTDGTIVTNVYRLAATPSVTFTAKDLSQAPALQMRAPTGRQPGPTFEYFHDGTWERVHTLRVGIDVYQAFAPGFGDYALVQAASSGTPASGGVGGLNVVLIVVGVTILVMVGVVALVRRSRARAA